MTDSNPPEASPQITAVSLDRHRHARVRRQDNYAHAARSHVSPLVVAEFASAASDYPIVLIKDGETGSFRAAALFGLEPCENVYHTAQGWNATYVPMNVSRYPFVIGLDEAADPTPCLCIDEASDRVSNSGEGDPLFDAQGAETPFLSAARQQMQRLFEGERQTQAFIATILDLRVIAPLPLQVKLDDGASRDITGLYGIDQDRLEHLADNDLLTLCRDGHMLALHAMLISQRQLNRLAQLHNAQNTPAIVQIALQSQT